MSFFWISTSKTQLKVNKGWIKRCCPWEIDTDCQIQWFRLFSALWKSNPKRFETFWLKNGCTFYMWRCLVSKYAKVLITRWFNDKTFWLPLFCSWRFRDYDVSCSAGSKKWELKTGDYYFDTSCLVISHFEAVPTCPY